MAARHKNKHKSRHRTHAVKPASLPRTSLPKLAPVAEVKEAPAVVSVAESKPKATRRSTKEVTA
jgi:hypothetical protein